MARTTKASKAFEDFTGRKPAREYSAKLDSQNVAGWEMGPVVGIAYEAVRDGERARYFHEFKKSARPRLVSRDDGKQLYITGGRYKVTDRGIEDMPQLFVVNPSPRKRKSRAMARTARRRRSHHRRRVAVFSRNPAPRRHRRRRRVAVMGRSYRRNPARRRGYRRNPVSRRSMGAGLNKLSQMILPAAGIGLGAVAAEVVMGYLPIPAQFKTGPMRHVTKGGVGVVGGLVIGKVLRQPRLGKLFAAGAIAIAVHDWVKEIITARMPAVPFGGMGAYLPASQVRGSLGYYSPAGMVKQGAFSEYVPASAVVGSLHGTPDFEV